MELSLFRLSQAVLMRVCSLRRRALSLLSSNLLEDVQKQYGLRAGFAHEYLVNGFGEAYNEKYRNLAQLFAEINNLQKMYLDFALSTNVRGEAAVGQLKPFLRDFHKKSIDVGCAYGGFVVAFAKAGYDAYGLEVDAGLARYGMLNCEDFSLHDRIIVGSILEVPLEELGTFDIITCNDVIEHVPDAERTLAILGLMLRPRGVLNMLIPNRDAISFVASDGHFQLFAVTLLEREYAKLYKYEMTGVEDDYEHMGEYYPLDFYVRQLVSHQLQVHQSEHHSIGGMRSVPALLGGLSAAYERWYENDRKRVSESLGNMVVDRYRAYAERLNSDLGAARLSGDYASFTATYLTSFWNIVGIKDADQERP